MCRSEGLISYASGKSVHAYPNTDGLRHSLARNHNSYHTLLIGLGPCPCCIKQAKRSRRFHVQSFGHVFQVLIKLYNQKMGNRRIRASTLSYMPLNRRFVNRTRFTGPSSHTQPVDNARLARRQLAGLSGTDAKPLKNVTF